MSEQQQLTRDIDLALGKRYRRPDSFSAVFVRLSPEAARDYLAFLQREDQP